jgi:RNA polymerase sigma-70 factor (ECF subfamily)
MKGCEWDVADALELALVVPNGFERALPVTDASPTPESADAALVDAARGGDRSAFGELYRRYARMVHGVLLASVPRNDVDDLVQDVFLAAMRRLASLREAAAFPGWLAAIARHRATDHFRRRPQDWLPLPDDVPAPNADDSEAREVLDVIRSLPDAYRETLVLRLVEGMTGQEIAARTGLTSASVRVNLHRGMKLLRLRLEGSGTP